MTQPKIEVGETDHCAASETGRHVSLEDTLEAVILNLLRQRGEGKTICPSEAARLVAPEDWRQLIQPTLKAAHRLVAVGKIVITQHGRTVDPSRAKGAIRLRLADGDSQ